MPVQRPYEPAAIGINHWFPRTGATPVPDAEQRGGRGAATGYFQCRLLTRLLTYSRPTKYPAASRTITTRIARDAGKVLCVAIIGEYICSGIQCQAERVTS